MRRMTEALDGVERVRRVDVPGKPTVFLFEVTRRKRAPVYVVWEQRDTFFGEDAPAIPVEWPWTASRAKAADVLGQTVPTTVGNGKLSLPVSVTPIFVE